MVKNRDIKGALATDHALREVVEKRVSDHWTLGTLGTLGTLRTL